MAEVITKLRGGLRVWACNCTRRQSASGSQQKHKCPSLKGGILCIARGHSGRVDPATEKNCVGWIVSNEEEKGVIGVELHPGWNGLLGSHSPTGCRCLCAHLIHLHKALVDNSGQIQIGTLGDSTQVSLGFIEDVLNAHVL